MIVGPKINLNGVKILDLGYHDINGIESKVQPTGNQVQSVISYAKDWSVFELPSNVQLVNKLQCSREKKQSIPDNEQLGLISFCSTRSPHASTYQMDSTNIINPLCSALSATNKSQQSQEKNSWEAENQTQVHWVQSEKAIHCATLPTPKSRAESKVKISHKVLEVYQSWSHSWALTQEHLYQK